MDLNKYLTAIKNEISSAYQKYESARMTQDTALEALKGRADSLTKDAYTEERNKITDTLHDEKESIVDDVKAAEKEQAGQFDNEVNEYYGANGGQIDADEMALIKSGLVLSLDEIWGRLEKYADNMTMLQLFEKYVKDNGIRLTESETGRKIHAVFLKLDEHGNAEKSALKTFIDLSMAGLEHIGIDDMYIWVWRKLDLYELQAQQAILEAKPVQTDDVKESIAALETQIDEQEKAVNAEE